MSLSSWTFDVGKICASLLSIIRICVRYSLINDFQPPHVRTANLLVYRMVQKINAAMTYDRLIGVKPTSLYDTPVGSYLIRKNKRIHLHACDAGKNEILPGLARL